MRRSLRIVEVGTQLHELNSAGVGEPAEPTASDSLPEAKAEAAAKTKRSQAEQKPGQAEAQSVMRRLIAGCWRRRTIR
jgi:hypothetical protein